MCPLSNMVLGYCKDLRTHPMRAMLAFGVQASINSDDPGFFGYEGVTLDYVYATGAWTLSIRDLKQLSLNGIKYSSISDAEKQYLREQVFEPKWKQWVEDVNNDRFQADAGFHIPDIASSIDEDAAFMEIVQYDGPKK